MALTVVAVAGGTADDPDSVSLPASPWVFSVPALLRARASHALAAFFRFFGLGAASLAAPDHPRRTLGVTWVALLVQRYLSSTASFVVCVVCRVKEHHNVLHYSPRLKNTCVRQVVFDK